MKKYLISEIFYSVQGEGARTGHPSIFIRFSGCLTKFACAKMGVECDTNFESSVERTAEEILNILSEINCKELVLTGGEPLDQLDDELIHILKENGYFICIETSGIHPIPLGIDYVAVSPKIAEHVLAKKIGDTRVDEVRYVLHKNSSLPNPSIDSNLYFLSPHFRGNYPDPEAINHCMDLALKNPKWKVSLQTHKLINVL
ncbi:7-carboxy-7-deazaguanine synthase QueE [Flammeovirga agarivorans]|uniref:7-carboxy-7-deazaguanine synthase n=1 Tax=Flammeovirga agarivorans TaxID=2726742 RepID=A0A7X8SR32_9BACT|nr:7-carboxy-7-deazaguanine synthase QueE [Flammeovirga agarivorans]NLR94859.1 radical SAM protein [Flammeovirga agarivorans]